MFEWIGWLGNAIKLIGDLIPQREQIPPTHRGIKYRGMVQPVVLQPGNHWFIPFFSEIVSMVVAQQTIELVEQQLTTADEKPVHVEGTITFTIGTTDEQLLKAMVETWDVLDQIDDEARGVFADYVTTHDFQAIQDDRETATCELTELVSDRLAEYGVEVGRAQLTTFVTGVPLLHVGASQ